MSSTKSGLLQVYVFSSRCTATMTGWCETLLESSDIAHPHQVLPQESLCESVHQLTLYWAH